MIQFQQISKSFGKQRVLHEATFVIRSGERVGVVGPNGAGKSTIFELLTGNCVADSGAIGIPSTLRIGHVRQQLNPHGTDDSLLDYAESALPELHAIEQEIHGIEHRLAGGGATDPAVLRRLGELQTVFEHLGGYELRARAEAILCGLGFDPAALGDPFRSFSGGWQIRAELARVLVSEPDILLLDEPTNYLDVIAVEWLNDFLRSFSGTLALVSHDRYLLNRLTQITLEVSGGMVTRYVGNYEQYVATREERYRQLLAAKSNQDRKREKLEQFVERFRAKATKASQAQSRMKMLDRFEEVQVPQIAIRAPRIVLPPPPRCGGEVVRLEDAGFSYDGARWIFEKVSMRLERGEKAAIVGLNGMGKTTLLRTLAGKLKPGKGKRVLGHNVEIGYQAQDFADVMDPEKTVYETARAAAVNRSDGDVRSLLGGFGFRGEEIDKKVQVLSGGEKVRLALARLLLKPCNFLLLDEPTTHLDIQAREALENALREYSGTICIVSHDIEFVRHLATSVYAITGDGLTKYFGDYDYYRAKVSESAASVQASRKPPPSVPVGPVVETPSGKDRKQSKREVAQRRQEFAKARRPLELRITTAEQSIERLEAEQARLLQELGSPEPGADFQGMSRRLGEVRKEIERLTGKWEEAGIELEKLKEAHGL